MCCHIHTSFQVFAYSENLNLKWAKSRKWVLCFLCPSMFTSLARGYLWHSVFPEWWLCRFCFQGTLKTEVAGSFEKLTAVCQITWYYGRNPLILLLAIRISLALWGKHFLTVIVLHLLMTEIFPPVVKYM
jgi:hypothetical protein